MVRFADLIAEHAEQIRYLETIVTGKPNAFSGFEVNDAVQNFKSSLGAKAGFPDGLLSCFTGGAVAGIALSEHARIRNISFTGSIGTGKLVAIGAANVVFSDADLDKAVSAAAAGITRYSGQICVAPSRLYLHEDIAEAFLVKLRKTVEDFATTFGADPLSPTTMSGPLFNHQQKKTGLAYLESGKKDATLLTGGSAVGDKGCYIQPTVFVDPQPDARVLREEVFGPVAVVVRFKTEEEAVALANDNENGLAAYVWTRDAARGFRMTRALEAGSVVVNGPMEMDARIPFGGWKQSGLGVENAVEGLKAWLQIKTVIMNA
ncbi:hypothetical protein MCOR29_011016 [Pyricularia oryzae]|nr:hypothetical protein MCOR26_007708 [Pyricularia oryzae]KAI6299441.1 hypothetical protein MCOR29_011016 [Pyricularia oryzae]KAI6338267.1 hypothetical protein MCOR28_008096 [Pyricularia oryzae]KAI6358012.1 hypothetical protein MCOR31_010057 [Pyricularia oryzae]KAI6364439.1 hypothetical protein MCOR32_007920 [Pyricularia oryzae]